MHDLSIPDSIRRDVLDRPKWRDSTGRRWNLEDMATRHVFYTLRMIWNNRMPEPVPDNPKFYRFDPRTHSDAYLLQMIPLLAEELSTRPDIPDRFVDQLEWMTARFAEFQKKIVQGIG